MRCEEPGVLRSYLDGELDQEASRRVQRHLVNCLPCQQRTEQLRGSARLVSAGLDLLSLGATEMAEQQARGWKALRTRLYPAGNGTLDARKLPAPERQRAIPNPMGGIWIMLSRALTTRQRLAFGGAIASLLLLGLLMLPAGQAAAIDFLNLFRVQRFAVVTVDPNQPFDALRHLESLGRVSIPSHKTPTNDVGMTPEMAGQRVGMQVRVPSRLPSGVSGKPQVSIIQGSEASFTIERAKAEAYLKSIAAPKQTVPANLDGARLVARVPGTVSLTYSDAKGQAQLAIAQLKSPSATVEGNGTLADVREFLLSVPGMPADTVAQLKAIDDWTNTLPVPLPRNKASWKEVSIDGSQALLVGDPVAGVGGLFWQRDGMVYVVGGKLNEAQLLDVARSLK